MRRLQGGLPRRGFLALGGAATWCAACAQFASAQGLPEAQSADAIPRKIQMCRESTSDAPQTLALDNQANWLQFQTIIAIEPAITLTVHYSFDARWDALPMALRRPVTVADHGKAIRLGLQRPIQIGTYRYCADGCPRHVQLVAAAIDHAAQLFMNRGFLPPKTDGGHLDVKLVNCDGNRGGTHKLGNVIEIERSLAADQAALTAAHELFHRVQFTYLQDVTVPPELRPMLMEGGARFAEDLVFDLADRYAEERRIWFTAQNVSLMTWSSPATSRPRSLSYETSLFWKYLAEQVGLERGAGQSTGDGAETQHQVLASLKNKPNLADDFSGLMASAWSRMAGVGHFDRIWHASESSDAVICDDTLWGNFAAALVLNGTGTADSRFSFEESRFWVRERNERMAIPSSQTVAFDVLHDEATTEPQSSAGIFKWRDDEPSRLRQLQYPPPPSIAPVRMLQPYAVRAYRVTMPEGGVDELLRVSFIPEPHFTDALVQIIMIGEGGGLSDLVRLDASAADGSAGRSLDHLVPTAGLSEVIVLVCSRRRDGDYSLRLTKAVPAALPFITSWNSPVGKHLTFDPRRFAWSWTSPDLEMLRNLQLGFKCVVRNRGTVIADEVEVHLEAAPLAELATSGLNPWRQIAAPKKVADVWPTGLCAVEREKWAQRRCDIQIQGALPATFEALDLSAAGLGAETEILIRARLFHGNRPVVTGGTAFSCIGGRIPNERAGWRIGRYD